MSAPTHHYDALILGAGAAGLMCAATAGEHGRRCRVIDHADQVGKKILISGGGRCNFTNIDAAPDRYLSANPHFAKSALSRYTPQDFIDLVNTHGIAWHEKTLGQLFCDGSAKQIVAMMMEACAKGEVEFSLGQSIRAVGHSDGLYRVTVGTKTYTAPSLVLATGGPSIPKMGATGFAYEVAKQFGLKLVEPRPALVPFTLPADEALFKALSGVAVDSIASAARGPVFREASLFTHKGLSGPAMLQISSYWRHGEEISVNLLPDHPSGWLIEAKRKHPRATLASTLNGPLPERLARALAELLSDRIGIAGTLTDNSDKALTRVEQGLAHWTFHPNGTEGFAKAEVTVGGIATTGLSSRTMEATKVPGLYAIGEAVDVTGWLGGYNFQWAWASGKAAGEVV